MKVIPREIRRITYSTKIRHLKTIPFSTKQEAFIIGSILGDGCLCENWSKTNYRLLITHSVKQEKYVEWKYVLLRPWILTPPRYYGKNKSVSIRTVSHPRLSELQKEFYRGKKKIIPQDIAKYFINPLTIAVWFMDDGNIAKNGVGKVRGYYLNSQSFTMRENMLLIKVLADLYQIKAIIETNHGKPRIGIFAKDSREKFKNLIKNLILRDLRYKIG